MSLSSAENKNNWPMRAVIALAVMIGFGYSITGQFVGWDDQDLIVGNAKLNPPTLHGFAEICAGRITRCTYRWSIRRGGGCAFWNTPGCVSRRESDHASAQRARVVLEILLLLFRVRWAGVARGDCCGSPVPN